MVCNCWLLLWSGKLGKPSLICRQFDFVSLMFWCNKHGAGTFLELHSLLNESITQPKTTPNQVKLKDFGEITVRTRVLISRRKKTSTLAIVNSRVAECSSRLFNSQLEMQAVTMLGWICVLDAAVCRKTGKRQADFYCYGCSPCWQSGTDLIVKQWEGAWTGRDRWVQFCFGFNQVLVLVVKHIQL